MQGHPWSLNFSTISSQLLLSSSAYRVVTILIEWLCWLSESFEQVQVSKKLHYFSVHYIHVFVELQMMPNSFVD